MARNPYDVLGVSKDADLEAIRTAYRKLAKRNHPDLNPGNKEAEARFKEIASAYDLLSDKDKRARFDRGEIDETGAERPPPQQTWRGFAEGAPGEKYETQIDPEDLETLFGMFGGERRGQRGNFRMRGPDHHFVLALDFLDAVNGGVKRLDLPQGRTLDVTVPAGVEDGQVLRLKGQGGAGIGGGPQGDALVEIRITPHKLFRRDGNDIHIELPVTLGEAVLGGRVSVPTPSGAVMMTVPAGSNTGRVLRVRGKGVKKTDGAAGDEYVTLKVVLPEGGNAELADFLRGWAEKHPYDPRRGMEGT
ncbi:MAG TPA: DnaJ C-terminal domain-containing protein [Stellaceae bacterium]|nr:DnaJ C-terminal domain-containing protein [Stellaceae bacterium]